MEPVRSLVSARAGRVMEFEDICKHVAGNYFAPGLDRDDLLQEARIGALKGLRDYRQGHGTSLRSFVSHCAERQVKTATRAKHRALNTALLLDAPAPGEDGENATWHDALPERGADVVDLLAVRERLHEIATLFREQLTDLELGCLLGQLNGHAYEQIAAELGVTEKVVDNALQRARWKLSGARKRDGRDHAAGYSCPSCGGATVKKPGRGRPPRCVVCRVRGRRVA